MNKSKNQPKVLLTPARRKVHKRRTRAQSGRNSTRLDTESAGETEHHRVAQGTVGYDSPACAQPEAEGIRTGKVEHRLCSVTVCSSTGFSPPLVDQHNIVCVLILLFVACHATFECEYCGQCQWQYAAASVPPPSSAVALLPRYFLCFNLSLQQR